MSIFTRRHYVWLASAMRDVLTATCDKEGDIQLGAEISIETLTDALEGESPAFNRQRFLDAVYRAGELHNNDEKEI